MLGVLLFRAPESEQATGAARRLDVHPVELPLQQCLLALDFDTLELDALL
jgi:hypothetical protein